jgi:hypothetical protein
VKPALKILIFLILTLPLCPLKVFSQDGGAVKDLPFTERIFFGGNFGLQFGTITFIDISPLVGYLLTDRLSAGTGITYMYYREKFAGFQEFSTSIYGGRLFARYLILKNLFAHTEYEVLNLEAFDLGRRVNVTSVLVGGGYRQQLGGNVYLNLLALWNINETAYSPYRNPIIRMGVAFGL